MALLEPPRRLGIAIRNDTAAAPRAPFRQQIHKFDLQVPISPAFEALASTWHVGHAQDALRLRRKPRRPWTAPGPWPPGPLAADRAGAHCSLPCICSRACERRHAVRLTRSAAVCARCNTVAPLVKVAVASVARMPAALPVWLITVQCCELPAPAAVLVTSRRTARHRLCRRGCTGRYVQNAPAGARPQQHTVAQRSAYGMPDCGGDVIRPRVPGCAQQLSLWECAASKASTSSPTAVDRPEAQPGGSHRLCS